MLVELTLTPLGRGTHLGQDLAAVLKLIDESGLPYCLTPTGTCIEGEWDDVMALVKQCHHRMRSTATRVLTTVRIDDESGVANKLTQNIKSVEGFAQQQFKHA